MSMNITERFSVWMRSHTYIIHMMLVVSVDVKFVNHSAQ